MWWICPKCYGKSLIPGKCGHCNEVLVPAPKMPIYYDIIKTIANDPKALTATVELATFTLRVLFGRR